MQRSDFHFALPEALIARQPPAQRGDSRLLCLDGASGECRHADFGELPGFLKPGDLLVFNDTRVIPARLFGLKATGGKVEVLIERLQDRAQALVHIRSSKAPRAGTEIQLLDRERAVASPFHLQVLGRERDLFRVQLAGDRGWLEVLDTVGHMPLPPYIDRDDQPLDRERYQTVYADRPGAVAAPTAGLHFDEAMLETLAAQGVASAFVTLHVGAGTFQPVRVDDIRDHVMHSEWLQVTAATCRAVQAARARGGRVIAVGTTSVRCLESAAGDDGLQPFEGETDIFIYPGYQFRAVDAMITNFHLPESTLLMLVSAFAGREAVLAAYREAVARGYRFFSYGDAMLLLPQRPAGAAG